MTSFDDTVGLNTTPTAKGTEHTVTPGTPDPDAGKVNPAHTTNDGQDGATAEATTGAAGTNRLTDEGVMSWTAELAHETRSAWSTIGNFFDSPTAMGQATKVANLDSIAFTNPYTATTPPTGTDTTSTVASTTDTTKSGGGGGGLSGFFSSLESDASGAVKNPLDWLFKSNDGSTVTSDNGTATFSGTKDGNNVVMGVDQTNIAGQAGDVTVAQNKTTHQTQLVDGDFVLSAQPGTDGQPGTTTATDKEDGYTLTVTPGTQGWTVKDATGKVLGTGTGEGSVQQQVQDGQVTATAPTQSAAQAADAAAKKTQQDPDQAPKYQYFVDNQGNYGIVENNGLEVKTDKATGTVTIEKDGHQLRIQDGHVQAQESNGQWVDVRTDRDLESRLEAAGLEVGDNGAVSVNGKQVVDSSGNVQVAGGQTTVNTQQGSMTTKGTQGEDVKVKAGNGQSTIQDQGHATLHHDDHGWSYEDPKTGKTVTSYNDDTHHFTMQDGHGGTIDIDPQGTATMVDANGQRTVLAEDGSMATYDATGNELFGIDASGDVTFYDGTQIDADGDVTDANGDSIGNSWDGGDGDSAQPGQAAVVAADTAVGAALSAAIQNPQGGLAALEALDANLSTMAQQFTAQGDVTAAQAVDNADALVKQTEGQLAGQANNKVNQQPGSGTGSGATTFADAGQGLNSTNYGTGGDPQAA